MPAKTKILVVDDDQQLVYALTDRLKNEGYSVISAYDGIGAMKKVKEDPPDLVILDIVLPDIDGFELCEMVKKLPETEDIPVIMLTGKDKGEDFEKALDKKADWYIVKPYDDNQLLRTVESLLNKSRKKH
ncbi:PleD family two-component system response regulator [Elusimicrobiota bacterium]